MPLLEAGIAVLVLTAVTRRVQSTVRQLETHRPRRPRGPPTLVLLHGYGSSAGQVGHLSHRPFGGAGERAVSCFPQATGDHGPASIESRSMAATGGGALDLASHVPPGEHRSPTCPEIRRPRGLAVAADRVEDLLERSANGSAGSRGARRIFAGRHGRKRGGLSMQGPALGARDPLPATLVDEPSWESHSGSGEGPAGIPAPMGARTGFSRLKLAEPIPSETRGGWPESDVVSL